MDGWKEGKNRGREGRKEGMISEKDRNIENIHFTAFLLNLVPDHVGAKCLPRLGWKIC